MTKPPAEDGVVRCVDFAGEEWYILWRAGEWRCYTGLLWQADKQKHVSMGAYNGVLVGWKPL